jgi:hypothetical protein
MNPAPQTPAPRRGRIWFWVLLGAGLCLTPFALLGIAAVSYLTLDRDVRTLRHHVMAATDADWSTKVQMSVGRVTLGVAGQVLRFVEHDDIDDARLALGAVKHASVGVYERDSGAADWSREQLFAKTDRAMQNRGWSRLVGVLNPREAVLVYVQDDADEGDPIRLCIAVANGRELVVVSTSVNPDQLGELVAKHTGDKLKQKIRLAKFSH